MDEDEDERLAAIPVLPPEQVRNALVAREEELDLDMRGPTIVEPPPLEYPLERVFDHLDSRAVMAFLKEYGAEALLKYASGSVNPESNVIVAPSDLEQASAGVLLAMADNGQLEAVVRVFEALSTRERAWSDPILNTPVLAAVASCRVRAPSEGGGVVRQAEASEVMLAILDYVGPELASGFIDAQRPENAGEAIPLLLVVAHERRYDMLMSLAERIAKDVPVEVVTDEDHFSVFACVDRLLRYGQTSYATRLLDLFVEIDPRAIGAARYGKWRAGRNAPGAASPDEPLWVNVLSEAIINERIKLVEYLAEVREIMPWTAKYYSGGGYVAEDVSQADPHAVLTLMNYFGPTYFWSNAGTDLTDGGEVNFALLQLANRDAFAHDVDEGVFTAEAIALRDPTEVATLGDNNASHDTVAVWKRLCEGRLEDDLQPNPLLLNWSIDRILSMQHLEMRTYNGTLWSVLCRNALPATLMGLAPLANDEVFLTMNTDSRRFEAEAEPQTYVTELYHNDSVVSFVEWDLDHEDPQRFRRFHIAFLTLFASMVPARVAHRPFFGAPGDLTPWEQAERLVDDPVLSGAFRPHELVKSARF